ncbi:MAG: Gfo/Idh/MocA family oxidoreductase [Capsulimonadaceae bacterium]|nr:Gfo/Idh/MocA family oxidoreductase [Capsulimonadaceae bacterium]
MPNQKFRWGILGPGSIARSFATGLAALPEHELYAIGSRSKERADAFAAQYGATKTYDSYEALVADPNVDAIYASRPHTFHSEDALLCIRAGKPVLVEKPFAVNERQSREVIDAAREAKVFVMEAMWSRFIPITVLLRKLVAEGRIGEPRMIQADFGFRAGLNPEGRLFNLALAGGGLLDVGVYPLSFSSMIFGEPAQVASIADIGSTGVDEQAGVVLGHKGGQISLISTGVRINTLQEAVVLGTEGNIRLPAKFWNPRKLVINAGGKEEIIEIQVAGNGYEFEALEVAANVRAGRIESESLPHSETVSIIRTCDRIRSQWGLKYPVED